MFAGNKKLLNQKGFTLVELMTVVAIIGALAAVGVPQYKKMQRKAKRAEANMVLGVIASAEAAFYAEYNGYGSNMGGIGAEMDNDPQYYNVGFHGYTTPQLAIFGATAVTNTNPQNFPGYTAATIRPPACGGTLFGSTSTAATGTVTNGIAGCYTTPAGALAAIPGPQSAAAPSFGCSTTTNVLAVSSSAPRPTFVALAAGNLYQNAGAAPRADCVTIDNNRTINLVQDGS